MKEDAAKFVGSIPEHYDSSLGPRIFSDFAADLAGRLSIDNPKRILELAAGTGIVSRKLRDLLPEECEIVITDLNEPMLEAARKKFQADEFVTIRQADAMSLPFGDGSYDRVMCQFGVMFFPEKLKSFQEVYRVLKSGGSYIFNVWDSWDYNPFAQIAHETVSEFFPDNPPGFYKVPFGYRDTSKISHSLLEAGFSNVTNETVSLESKIPCTDDFAQGLVFGNPLIDEIITRKGNPEEIREAVSTSLKMKLGDRMRLQAIVVSADKD